MNFPLFIARRLSGGNSPETSSSRVMVRIAVVSIALSIAVMIIAIGVVGGFKKVLTQRISGFAGDLQMTLSSNENRSMIIPYSIEPSLLQTIRTIEGVRRVEGYATAKGLLQSAAGVEGVVMRGVDRDYDWSFLSEHLVAGALPIFSDSTRSREAVISSEVSRKMGVGVGDVFKFIVVNENPRRDRFRVAAIYDSGLSEFDSMIIFGDIQTVRRINNWLDTAVEGYQIYTTGETDLVAERIYEELPSEGLWRLDTLQENFPQLFDWITMLDVNTMFVLVIMLIVAVINMLCGILVIVLESVRMIGVLKTQGITLGMLQRIFLYRTMHIVL